MFVAEIVMALLIGKMNSSICSLIFMHTVSTLVKHNYTFMRLERFEIVFPFRQRAGPFDRC